MSSDFVSRVGHDDTQGPGTASAIATEPLEHSWSEQLDVRVPGLTILYHPDLSRVGEWKALPGLASGHEQPLSRLEPDFHAPGSARHHALDDRYLSRSPVMLRGLPDGSIELDRGGSGTPLVVNGQSVAYRAAFDRRQLDSGLVILFGDRVVLLLHLLDPLSVSDLPTFGLVGESPEMVRVRQGVQQVADLDVPVLLRGETGTGKELVAQAIHRQGSRRQGSMVSVNMAAVPSNLAASELFGAARGAYTGAERQRPGFFRRADGGTLFLDEIGETPPEVQALLLRALETGEIQQVGGGKPHRVDVRVISATDRELEASHAAEGRSAFKAPLLHRLSGFVIHLPPLRARLSDFGLLLVHFLRREFAEIGETRRLDAPQPWLPPVLAARLAEYAWPGNVRQLQNVVRQLVIAHRGASEVPPNYPVHDILHSAAQSGGTGGGPAAAAQASTAGFAPAGPTAGPPASSDPEASRERRTASEISDSELLASLRAHRWRLKATADALGLARSSLYDRIDRHPHIRKASDIGSDEILAVRERYQGNVEAMAEGLEVSARALRRRMGQLGL